MSYQAYRQLNEYWKNKYKAEKPKDRGILGDVGKAVGLGAFILSGGAAAPLSLGMVAQGASAMASGEAVGKGIESGDVVQTALGLGQLGLLEKQIKTKREVEAYKADEDTMFTMMTEYKAKMVPEEEKAAFIKKFMKLRPVQEKAANSIIRDVLEYGEPAKPADPSTVAGDAKALAKNKVLGLEAVKKIAMGKTDYNKSIAAWENHYTNIGLGKPTAEPIFVKTWNSGYWKTAIPVLVEEIATGTQGYIASENLAEALASRKYRRVK